MGWIQPTEIVNDGTYTLRASEVFEDYYVISQPYEADGEYLLIENRQPLLFDERLWAPGGVVIYHIDDNVDRQDTRGFPGQQGWPQNGNHYRVAVLQADGRYDLEKSVNDGDSDDFWNDPSQSLGPGPNNHPNTDSYAFGNVAQTGITISAFTEVEPGVWSFDVSGLGSGNPSPPTPETPTQPPATTPVPVEVETIAPTTMNGTVDVNGTDVNTTEAPTTTPTLRPSIAPSPAPSPSPTSTPSSSPSRLPPAPPLQEESKGKAGLAVGLSLGVVALAGAAYVFYKYYYTRRGGGAGTSSPSSSFDKSSPTQDEDVFDSEDVSDSDSASAASEDVLSDDDDVSSDDDDVSSDDDSDDESYSENSTNLSAIV